MNPNRALSWSQIDCFRRSKEQWYKRYVLGEKQPENAEMKFGKIIGEKLASDPKFLPFIKRHNTPEHLFSVKFGDIYLKGYGDFFCNLTKKKLQEVKTGVREWDQKRVDEHEQIDMYLLMHFITEKIRPEEMECELIWLPTKREEGGDFDVKISLIEPVEKHVRIIKTKRTTANILKFGAEIRSVYKEMQNYAASYPHVVNLR